MKKAVLIILFLLSSHIFVGASEAQTVTNPDGDAPNTTRIVEDCLSGGGSSRSCADEGADYLRDQGYDADTRCNGSGCTITCNNGSEIVIENPPPRTSYSQSSYNPSYSQSSYTPSYSQSSYRSYSQSSYTPSYSQGSYGPTFNNEMCKCDGMTAKINNYNSSSGEHSIQVEAFAKVQGQTDLSLARVGGMNFRVFEGNPSSQRITELVDKRASLPVTVESGGVSVARYKATWITNLKMTPGEEYRIMANPNCEQIAMAQPQMQTAVLAETTENIGLLGQITNFFAGIFGQRSEPESIQTQSARENVNPIQQAPNTITTQQSDGGEQIQIGTYIPVDITYENQQACTIVKLKVPEFNL